MICSILYVFNVCAVAILILYYYYYYFSLRWLEKKNLFHSIQWSIGNTVCMYSLDKNTIAGAINDDKPQNCFDSNFVLVNCLCVCVFA